PEPGAKQTRPAPLTWANRKRLVVLVGIGLTACLLLLTVGLLGRTDRPPTTGQQPPAVASAPAATQPAAQPPTTAALSDTPNRGTVKEQSIRKDEAILELEMPVGARAAIDGQDLGDQARHVFRGVTPTQFSQREAKVRFQDGREWQRTLLVRGGERLRLVVPA